MTIVVGYYTRFTIYCKQFYKKKQRLLIRKNVGKGCVLQKFYSKRTVVLYYWGLLIFLTTKMQRICIRI